MRIMRFNEGIFSFKKKNIIDDLYISKVKYIKKVIVPSKDDYINGMEIQDFDLYKDYKINSGIQSGVFIYNQDEIYRKYSFGKYSGGVWFDISNCFDKLNKISEKLGLVYGASVIADSKEGVIDDINLFALYKCLNGALYEGFDKIITLCYNVNGRWYQPSELTLIKDVKKSSIIGEEIEDNFLDMIESGELTFRVKEEYIDKKQSWRTHIYSDLSTTQGLDKVTSQLLSMSKRLEQKNISTKIVDINLSSIQFTCSSF